MNKSIEMKTINDSLKQNDKQTENHAVKMVSNGNFKLDTPGGSDRYKTDLDVTKERRSVLLSCVQRVFSWRYATVWLLHSSFVVATFIKNCMPIALVCMTQTTQYNNSTTVMENSGTTSMDGVVGNGTLSEFEFNWDPNLQGLILSSVAFLGVLAPLLSNAMEQFLGHRLTLTMMTLVSTVLTFLTPMASRTSPWLLIAVRIAVGATFGANVPVIGDYVAWWAPRTEKQTMTSIIFSGLQTGGILTFVLSGYLCTIPLDNGWPFIFYVIGVISIVWVILWLSISSSKPENHKYISDKELEYILANRDIKETKKTKTPFRPPYKTILTSVPVLALLVSTGLHYWTVNLFFTYQAIFLAAVLKFDATEVGLLMSGLSLLRLFGMIFWTVVVNQLQKVKRLTNTMVKKIGITCGMSVAATCLIVVIFQDHENLDNRWTIIISFFVAMIFQSSGTCILPAIPQDMAPRYAGFTTGLFFSCGGLLSVSGPLIVAAITPHNSADEWRRVWIILAVIFVIILLIFVILGDATIQPWAQEHQKNAPVSPFDPMQIRFSAAYNASPLTPVGVNNTVNPFTFNIELEKIHVPTITVDGSPEDCNSVKKVNQSQNKRKGQVSGSNQPASSNRGDNRGLSISLSKTDGGIGNNGFVSDLDMSGSELHRANKGEHLNGGQTNVYNADICKQEDNPEASRTGGMMVIRF